MKVKQIVFLLILTVLFGCGSNKPSGLYEFVSSKGEVKSFNIISDSTAFISSNESGLSLSVKYRIEKNYIIFNIPDIGDVPVEITKDGLKTAVGELYEKKSNSSTPTIKGGSDGASETVSSSPSILLGKTYTSKKGNDALNLEQVTETIFFISTNSVQIKKINQFNKVYLDETMSYRVEGDFVIIKDSENLQQSFEVLKNGEGIKNSDGLIYFVNQETASSESSGNQFISTFFTIESEGQVKSQETKTIFDLDLKSLRLSVQFAAKNNKYIDNKTIKFLESKPNIKFDDKKCTYTRFILSDDAWDYLTIYQFGEPFSESGSTYNSIFEIMTYRNSQVQNRAQFYVYIDNSSLLYFSS